MKPFTQRYPVGQIHCAWFRRGSTLVAIDGTLRVTYRDASMDWLLDAAPRISVVVRPGEQHTMPFEAFVEVSAVGLAAVNARIADGAPRRSLLAAWRRLMAAVDTLKGAHAEKGNSA
jgi:hypothetical protein